MERLRKKIIFLVRSSIVLLCIPVAAAQSYCSLTVQVETKAGLRPEVPVTVLESNGRKIEKEQSPTKSVHFCDLGILPVTVIVGVNGCNQVVINDVPLSWHEPYTLKVTHDYESCMKETLPPSRPKCKILFRVMNSRKEWVSKGTIDFDTGKRAPLHTDNSGRAFLSADIDGKIEGFASAAGLSAKHFSITCPTSRIHEEILTLEDLKKDRSESKN